MTSPMREAAERALELDKRATAGPWGIDDPNTECVIVEGSSPYEYIADASFCRGDDIPREQEVADAAFIAAAREGYPQLARWLIEALDREVEKDKRIAELEAVLPSETRSVLSIPADPKMVLK